MYHNKRLILSYSFVTLLGVLLHFTYEWSGNNFFVGLFSAVNESTWEHLKLVFFPMLVLTTWNIFNIKKSFRCTDALKEQFLPVRTLSILATMLFIVIIFYTFTGVTGKNVDFINIAIYFLTIAFGFFIEKRIYKNGAFINNTASIAILLVFTFLFFIFSYHSPNVGIFSIP